jgi:hypothetical protein
MRPEIKNNSAGEGRQEITSLYCTAIIPTIHGTSFRSLGEDFLAPTFAIS